MTERKGEEKGCRCRCRVPSPVIYAFIILALIAFAIGVSFWIYRLPLDDRSQPPVFTMAITGVTGLDDVASDGRPTLSPVFDLTLRINNTRGKYQACIPVLSTALVFYGDALLGKGSLQPFCAEPNGESEGRARAWGKDVAVPRFLRDQLAGELRRGDPAVDVTVKMPQGCDVLSCYETVLVCKARFGGGPPCQMTQVQPGVLPT